MVELVFFNDEKEAASIKTLLEANNIKVEVSFLPNWTYGGGANPQAKGKGMIYVEKNEVKRAMAILEKHEGKEVKIERMPLPIESPEDKLEWKMRRLKIIASYKNHFWPGTVMFVFGEVVIIKAFLSSLDEPRKYALLAGGFILIFMGILILVSSKEGKKAEKELQKLSHNKK